MKSIKDAGTNKFAWTQTGDLETQLVADGTGEDFASLKWAKSGSLAMGESSDGSWSLKRVGFLHPRVTVRQQDSQVEVATYYPNWSNGGVLELEGQKFNLKRSSMWKAEWVLSEVGGQNIMTVLPSFGWKKIGAIVEIDQGALSTMPQISLLAIVTWYVLILMYYDEMAATASTGATIAAIS